MLWSKTGMFGRATRRLVFLLSISLLGCSSQAGSPPPAQGGKVPEAESDVGQLAPGEPLTALPIEADDARLGSDQAKVTVVAFLDYQCSFCAQGFATLLALRRDYSDDDLRIVFKHLPLAFHELALPSAIAGQAVMQGAGPEAFFQFSRRAFENQSALGFSELAKWAEEAGLPREHYNELVSSEQTVQRIVQDARLASQIGVDATPAFFINGRMIAGAQPKIVFQEAISEELAAIDELQNGKAKVSSRSAYRTRVSSNMRGSVLSALLAADPNDYLVPVDGSPIQGPTDAPVTLVVFTDFECPFCKRADDTIKMLRKKHGSDLRVVFKHLPLSFHERARPAALLAAAVQKHRGDQAFFAAASALFEQSPSLDEPSLRRVGRTHGLSEEQIELALTGRDVDVTGRIQRDLDLSDDVLARGTPHFFINGKRLSGARPLEHFDALISHGKKRANDLMKEGVRPADVYARLQEQATSPGRPEKLASEIPEASRPERGPKDAPVVVHIFSDFQCPYCRVGEQTLLELEASFPGKLRFVWHDFPLDFHEQARPAARAAREVFRQKGNSAFWKMHALLFDLEGDEAKISDEDIVQHGSSLGMDGAALLEVANSTKHDAIIDEEIEFASSLGIRGTPAFVIGGYLVTGAKPAHYLERVVSLALSDKAEEKATAHSGNEPEQATAK